MVKMYTEYYQIKKMHNKELFFCFMNKKVHITQFSEKSLYF